MIGRCNEFDLIEWMRIAVKRQDNLQEQINLISAACRGILSTCTLVGKRVKVLEDDVETLKRATGNMETSDPR